VLVFVLGDPKRLRTRKGHGFLVGWKHKLKLQGRSDAVDVLVARLLADPSNLAALRAGLGRAGASEEELAEVLRAGLVEGGLVLLKTRPRAPVLDAPAEMSLFDLLPPERARPGAPETVSTGFSLRVVDEAGEPLRGVETRWLVDGASVVELTDTTGVARTTSADGASFASATVVLGEDDLASLAERWEAIRNVPILDEDEHRTLATCGELRRGDLRIPMEKEREHTLVVYPDVTLVRLMGLFFQSNRSFLLPDPQLPLLRNLYASRGRSNLLVVGHTDTTGEPDVNDPLSLERAEAVSAYLRDDVDAWVANYEELVPNSRRWGSNEDLLMLDEILRRDGGSPSNRVRHYQETRGLEVDGDIGSQTRRCLVREYMALDGVTLPEAIDVEAHGCGERFPVDEQGDVDTTPEDGREDAHDRRVELFFFDDGLGVLPPTEAGEVSPYLEWRRRARQTLDFRGAGLSTRVPRLTLDGFFNHGSAVLLPAKPWRLPMDAVPPTVFPELPSFLATLFGPLIQAFRTGLDYLEPERDRRANVAVSGLVGLLFHLAAVDPDATLFLAGHAAGPEPGDIEAVSRARARCVLDVLLGDAEAFSRAHEVAGIVEDDYVMVRHLSRAMGWSGDPGPPVSEPTEALASAVLQFQRSFNYEFGAELAEDGAVGSQTRGAYGRVFQRLLSDRVGGENALAELRASAELESRATIRAAASEYPAEREASGGDVLDARVELVCLSRDLAEGMDLASLYGGAFEFEERKLSLPVATPATSIRDVSSEERGRPDLPEERSVGTDTSDYQPVEPDDPWDFLNAVPSGWVEFGDS
jgi:outer membrane protein OmpA-like peptidoglycan-associated protein